MPSGVVTRRRLRAVCREFCRPVADCDPASASRLPLAVSWHMSASNLPLSLLLVCCRRTERSSSFTSTSNPGALLYSGYEDPLLLSS